MIVSAHEELGDEKLIAGDATVERAVRLAVAAIPTNCRPSFLQTRFPYSFQSFLRGQQAHREVARWIEVRVKDEPVAVADDRGFLSRHRSGGHAMRAAELAIKLAPEVSAAYQARDLRDAWRYDLTSRRRITPARLSLTRSLKAHDGSLAELRRATGKTEEALELYRELLKTNSAEEFARTGLIVSLFELGRKEEAERELEAALKDMPNSLALLTGVGYWFAAHNDSTRAIEFAQKAVQIEPRYTWAK